LLVNMFSGLVSSPAVKKSQLVFRVLGWLQSDLQ
jgi:hypothetical protein